MANKYYSILTDAGVAAVANAAALGRKVDIQQFAEPTISRQATRQR